jgi:hypothetical protein
MNFKIENTYSIYWVGVLGLIDFGNRVMMWEGQWQNHGPFHIIFKNSKWHYKDSGKFSAFTPECNEIINEAFKDWINATR